MKEPSEDARAAWDRLAPNLMAVGVLTPWDVDAFAVVCEALTRYKQATKLVSGSALLVQGPNGFVKNPRADGAAGGRGHVRAVRREVAPQLSQESIHRKERTRRCRSLERRCRSLEQPRARNPTAAPDPPSRRCRAAHLDGAEGTGYGSPDECPREDRPNQNREHATPGGGRRRCRAVLRQHFRSGNEIRRWRPLRRPRRRGTTRALASPAADITGGVPAASFKVPDVAAALVALVGRPLIAAGQRTQRDADLRHRQPGKAHPSPLVRTGPPARPPAQKP
ncbi:phage terminase small subunit [Saccharopolyspora spinosa]|uniref:Phage terminase small subunit n=2 Tax=Saccharopolyspora spinosa TaxID=60894 RepID=A0A2N3Y693_SACSN|nr:phage terminase small subunit [Saccharopolyspora spinosa]